MLRKLLKRAQGATEYLIILAVVIIIALIVVGAMGGIPGVGTGAKARASSSFWQTADVAVTSNALSAAQDVLVFNLRNNNKDSISGIEVVMSGTAGGCAVTTLAVGQTTNCSVVKTCANSGDAYAYDALISYVDTSVNKRYNFTGDGHQVEGKCST